VNHSPSQPFLAAAALFAVGVLFAGTLAVNAQSGPDRALSGGRSAPAFPDKYEIERPHSAIEFVIGYLGFSHVRGRFTDFRGTILLPANDWAHARVDVVVGVPSLTTDVEFRDKHLKTADFFDAQTFPKSTFHSALVTRSGDSLLMRGALTMHGVTKDVTIGFRQTVARTIDPNFGFVRVAFEGHVMLDRKDFGIEGGMKFNPGHTLAEYALTDSVRLDLTIVGNTRVPSNIIFPSSPTKLSIADTLQQTIATKGIGAALAQYAQLKTQSPDAYLFGVLQLSLLGTKLEQQGRLSDAIEIFKLNAATFPQSSAAFDDLGEAYARNGNTDGAIASYRSALALDADDTTAMAMLRWLGAP
jgi:polyisoprenoid-binding protein YceI